MRNALVVDLDRCSGCFSCEVACKMENGIALGSYYNKVLTVGPFGEFPKLSQYFLPVACQQCEDAPCVSVCPTGASYRDPDTNIVLVDKSKCIGCKYCMMACPYGVRSWNGEEKCVEKCTLCGHLTSNGDLPACVHNCPGGARFYGDLDDPSSDASQAVAAADPAAVHRLTDVGNAPATCYILSDHYAEWQESSTLQGSGRYLQKEGE
ncbi:4Fe-4S dicluster domain-containing protein [uncultured Adlercreutzia sp.]|uniref:4Fe-4S dicluster domain-containing protein n=1 Tax=uncultured Adlercreutzia sp. TaxID=875803 RepID=UPI00272DE82B|nr:4Fe-4S dicluster domain-containing protein [uncultured Adlercreutzia sp.]MEE0705062.1 4Fe-4S dicluster domain-containing protein [Adlercreutzia sp.]